MDIAEGVVKWRWELCVRLRTGVTMGKWNVKRLTERHLQEWSLRLNTPHQVQNTAKIDKLIALSSFSVAWCMAVLCSCLVPTTIFC